VLSENASRWQGGQPWQSPQRGCRRDIFKCDAATYEMQRIMATGPRESVEVHHRMRAWVAQTMQTDGHAMHLCL